ncbi:MAG: ABC transporter permease [Candidatus Marinimicrobia bacterium]|nr:ABC transporter permease [Candidatus Neomarinimicrobiota bacterium]
MFKHISIAYRQLFSKHSFGFIYITSVLGVLGLSIGISSLIIISCLSDGFSNLVNSKLSSIDGNVRITSYYDDTMDLEEAEKILNVLNLNNQVSYSQLYTENHAMLKNKGNSEGVIIYGCSDSALINIFNVNDFIISGSINNFNSNGAILGSALAHNLNLEIGDEFYLFNVDDIVLQNKINALKLKLNAIIDTDFSEYDRLLAFVPISTSQTFFLNKHSITGIISQVAMPLKIDALEDDLFAALEEFPVYITTWKNRHRSIITWLNIYDIPIKLIMIFIVLVSIFNLTATIWMVSFERKSEFAILKAMGFLRTDIRNIILSQSLILAMLGCLFGAITAFFILLGQHHFHWISLASEIYFMNYLPVSFDGFYFLFYPILGLFFSFLISFIPASKISNYSPASVLMYE